uniref:C2 domain-containing protein n=1 Tax=Oncorhynchus tshawytscha TaxID=74940 RepID=A0AAZ3QW65_ONCTS
LCSFFFLLRSPFYGEDFYCEIPRSFRHLSFYIFDRDVFRRDSSIGKVAVKKEDLQRYHGKDTWFPLRHVSADSEVQVSEFLISFRFSGNVACNPWLLVGVCTYSHCGDNVLDTLIDEASD